MTMDNGDFTVPKWEDRECKGPGDKMSNANSSRCSTPASGGSDDSSLQSVPERDLLSQLHSEIDVTKRLLFGTEELEAFLQSKVKPMLEKIHAEANKVVVSYKEVGDSDLRKYQQDRHILIHLPSLQELLLKLGFSKNMEELQRYLISSDRTCQLSENQTLKMELRDAQSRHETVLKGLHFSLRSAEQENRSSQLTLQQSLRQCQEKLQSQEHKRKESEGQILSLQQSLTGSNDSTQKLKKTLRISDMRLQSLQQDRDELEKKAQSLQHELRAALEDNQALQRNLGSSDQNVQSLRQNASDLEKKVEFLQQNLWVSEDEVRSLQKLSSFKGEAAVLRQNLKSSEEKVVSLQNNQWAAEERAQSLQQKLSSSEERAQSLQQKLSSSEERAQSLQCSVKDMGEKARLLQEYRNSWKEKTQALEEALRASESQLTAATAKQQSLERCKEEQDERIQSLIHSHTVSEEQHRITAKDKEEKLRSSREKVEVLQDALDRSDSVNEKEVRQLQQKLSRAAKKGAATERDLRDQMAVLNSKLLEEQTMAGKEIERSLQNEKELLVTITELRQKLKVQTEGRELALESLRSCQKDLTEVQRHLQMDLLRCSQAQGRQHSAPLRQSNLKEDFLNLKTSLSSVLESEGGREELRRQEWAKVLDKSREWERRAEKLVDSLDSLQSFHPFWKEEGAEGHHRAPPSAPWTSSLPYPTASLLQTNHSASHNSGLEKKLGSGSPRGVKNSECIQHLLTVQKRLKNLQSVDFQRNVKGLFRMS